MNDNKRRGRKKKDIVVEEVQETSEQKDPKKRGRKPKGGKIIQNTNIITEIINAPVNIILHLRCSMKDLDLGQQVTDPLSYNPTVPPEIMSYDDSNHTKFSFYSVEPPTNTDTQTKFAYSDTICKKCSQSITEENATDEIDPEKKDDTIPLKDIHQKLRKLRTQFYKNTLNDKKSACFWCTYEFDNEPCYIPKYELDQTIYGYGSFCRPECAAAYLMKENIDDSSKFERYYLLNQMYGKIFGYEKNIKLAPNPYYLLEKYYGNLTIQEYRKLLRMDHMLIVLEKPMTRVLPELHENNDMINTNVVNTNGNYKVKRQSEKQGGPSKSSIIRDCFNL
jgi:hypothetical protein